MDATNDTEPTRPTVSNSMDSDDENFVPPPPVDGAEDTEDEIDDDSDDDDVRPPPPPGAADTDDDDDAIDTEDDDAADTEDEDAAASDDDEYAPIGVASKVAPQITAALQNKQPNIVDYDSEPEDDTDDDENYLQKFDESLHTQVIADYHPEMKSHNYDEITNMAKVTRNESGAIIDPLHKSVPFITRYEKAKLIGERAAQLSAGATPLVEVDENIIDDYVIASKEFNEKKIPFIIKRPMPNGGCEYWRMEDLEILI
jgi:DNA-directed RNA polymerase I, II, and III subunit RPABC2